MSKGLLSLVCLSVIVALANGHAELTFPVPWLNKPATAGANKCPGTNPNTAAAFTLWAGDIPAEATEDLKLTYSNSMIWKVVASDGAGPAELQLATDAATLNFGTKKLTTTVTNGPAGTTPGADPSKVGPYNVTYTISAAEVATLLPAGTTLPVTNAVMRIGKSWAACVTVDVKAIPVTPKPADAAKPPAAAATTEKSSTSTSVAYNAATPVTGCVAVALPRTAFCYGTSSTGGASRTKVGEKGMYYFPYQIDAVRVPQLVNADGTFNAQGALDLDASLAELWEQEYENPQTFDANARETPECAEAYRRWLCADRFPVCGTPVEVGGACNSACENVLTACKPQPEHKAYLDCPNLSVRGVGDYSNKKFDSAGSCPALATQVNSASSLSMAPVAWLFVVAAALFLL